MGLTGRTRDAGVFSRHVRTFAALSGLALLAACAAEQATGPSTPTTTRASRPSSYDPPGPPSDPWGPYIREASRRFDVPDRWIREVMRQESAGRVSATSRVGAMGLLQLMPGTYAELQRKHGFGDDPYHPYDNIMSGTAYIREMYDLFGSPGFLAAYNGGPRRLENYLYAGRGLPDETRNYVARIGPRIEGASPSRRAPPEVYAAADIGTYIPRGPRQMDRGTMLALREQRQSSQAGQALASAPTDTGISPSAWASRTPAAAPVQVASLGSNVIRMDPIPDGSTYPGGRIEPRGEVMRMDPIPDGSTYPGGRIEPRGEVVRMDPIPNPPEPAPRAEPRVQLAEAPRVTAPAQASSPFGPASAPPRGGFFTSTAQASTLPPGIRQAAAAMPAPAASSAGNWGVQVGAFASENLARDAAGQARATTGGGRATVMAVAQGRATLHRARVTGLSREAAQAACDRLRRNGCVLVAPGT